MKTCGIALSLVLISGTAFAQEDLDAAIRALAGKISKEGLSGKLADAAASDAGIQAIHEKIDFLLAARISRFERDAVGHLEDYLFIADANGDLHLRPERKPEIDALVQRLILAPRAMTGFSRRADDIVRRLGDTEMDKRAKAAWSDHAFRTAFFHRHPAELRELDDAELLDAAGFRGLERGKDGRLRVAGPYAQELKSRMAGIFEQLEAVKKFEKSYLKLVTQVNDGAARTALTADTCVLFLVGRVVRQVSESSPSPIGALTEADEDNKIEPAISFGTGLALLLPEVKDCEKTLADLVKGLDRIARDIDAAGTEELNVLEFLKNERARVLLAERILDLKEEQKRKADEIMNATIEDGFSAQGDRLSVKKGRFVDGEGKDSPDPLGAELHSVIEEFDGSIRQDFDRIAERCLDPGVIALFEDRPGTYLLMEFRDQVVERLAHSIRTGGIEVFTKTYLTKQGDLYVVRPERAARVEAILKRATDITAGK
jgi:hypothetical protein